MQSEYTKGLHCLSFDLELLVTPLVYSDCIVCPSIYNFWLALLCIQTIVCPKIYNFSLILWCIIKRQTIQSEYNKGATRSCKSKDRQYSLNTPKG
jgi:hypothetical protein